MKPSFQFLAYFFVFSCVQLVGSEAKTEDIPASTVATFKMLQKIHAAANNAQQYVRLKWDSQLDLPDGRLSRAEPNPYHGQMRQGLCIGVEYHPQYMLSPWGKVQLLTGGSGTRFSWAMTTYVFFEDLQSSLGVNPQFLSCVEPWYAERKGERSELLFDCKNKNVQLLKLNEAEYADIIGSKKIIVPREGSSVYLLKGSDESLLPNPTLIEKEKEFRLDDKVNTEWKLLNKLIDDEKLKNLPKAKGALEAE